MELALNYISAHLALDTCILLLLSCFSVEEVVSMYSLARKALVVHHGSSIEESLPNLTTNISIIE